MLHAGSLPGLFFEPEGGGNTCSSEMLADIQQDTQHYTPEDRTLHNQLCENSNHTYIYINCLINHHTRKTHGGVEVELHTHSYPQLLMAVSSLLHALHALLQSDSDSHEIGGS
jgi:hypothetical protein